MIKTPKQGRAFFDLGILRHSYRGVLHPCWIGGWTEAGKGYAVHILYRDANGKACEAWTSHRALYWKRELVL